MKENLYKKIAQLLILLVTLFATFNAVPSIVQSTIKINPAVTLQTMTGWEAVAQAGQRDCSGFNSYKDALYNDAVNDLGINRLRVAIKATATTSTTFNVDELDFLLDTVVVPIRQRLQAKGEKLFVNINFGGKSGFTAQPNMSLYAQQILQVYQHMQSKYGFLPDAWEIVLEPMVVSPEWDANHINQAINLSSNLLKSNGFSNINFIAPSGAGGPDTSVNILNQMLSSNNGKIPTDLKEFSYHRYSSPTVQDLQGIANIGSQYHINTAMLEHGGGDYNELHADLKYGNVSAWQQYALAYCYSQDNGYQYYLVNGNTYSIASRTKYLRQYFKFIRSGAVRIEATTENYAFDPVAFVNSDGKYIVVVKATQGGSFTIQGLPAGLYGIKYTTDSQYDQNMNDANITAGQPVNASIPATGVITIYGKTSSTSVPPPTVTATPGLKNPPSIYLPYLHKRGQINLQKQGCLSSQ